ncbi:metalloprotease [Aestuariivirga litoralis]|uniref:metalloprotease n=1 Tax=Aestuariivirga litoralis TaxID=2650924 RepID=UPI0018C7F1C8|nr:hypothetical protein [Aestuariivirga litoralis]
MQQIGPEIPLTIILLALLAFRMRVRPRTSLFIKTTTEKLWQLLVPYDGKVDRWGQVTASYRFVGEGSFVFEVSIPGQNGVPRLHSGRFQVAETVPHERLVLKRELEGKSENNELLEIRYDFAAEGQGTRLKTSYLWGKRPFLAQLLARADLWGGAFRLKGLAETGTPGDKAYWLIGAAVALVTGLLSLATFGLLLGFNIAAVLVLALFIHEFGHLLAFRMMGQPWGRLIFLPFLGAIAVPRLPFESQAQSVFAALMGPGLSCLLAIGCTIPTFLGWPHAMAYSIIGVVTAGLNLFNMLPTEPLDGGIALRSVLTKLVGKHAALGLMTIGVVIAAIGFAMGQTVMILFGGFAIVANLKPRKIDSGLTPLTSLQVSIAFLGYVSITAAHYTLLMRFLEQMGR